MRTILNLILRIKACDRGLGAVHGLAGIVRRMSKPCLVIAGLSTAPHAIAQADLREFDCVIEPHVMVEVSSATEGVIEKLNVDRNDVVSKGQMLAELNSGVEKANLELALARAEITSEVEYWQADLGLNNRKKRRVEELYHRKAVSVHERDEVVTNAKLAGIQLRQAKDKQRLAELDLKKAREALALRSIRSPVNGVVVERFKSPGEFVYDQQPLLKLAQLDPLRVEIIAPLQTYGSIRPGMRAEVMPESPIEGTYMATVTNVDQVVDAASGTFGVRLNLPNPEHKLPAGLKCRVRILPNQPGLEMTLSTNGAESVAIAPAADVPQTESETANEPVDARVPDELSDLRIALSSEASAVAEPSSIVCRTLGPFEKREQAEALVSALAEDIVAVNSRKETESTVTGYMVLIPPAEAGVAPNTLTRKLKDNSVDDQVLLGAGPYSGQISVGLYSGQRSAERRRDEVAALGYPAYVRPRVKEEVQTWLDIELVDTGGSEMKLLNAVDRIHPRLDVSISPCRQIARNVNGTPRSTVR